MTPLTRLELAVQAAAKRLRLGVEGPKCAQELESALAALTKQVDAKLMANITALRASSAFSLPSLERELDRLEAAPAQEPAGVEARYIADMEDSLRTLHEAVGLDPKSPDTDALIRRVRTLATPSPQEPAGGVDKHALAELREIMADESGEREASLVSFFRTTGAAMGRHGDAMGWTPEQTARHYLSEASK